MATTKRSVTLDEDLVAEALAFAGERGLSAIVNEGLRKEVLLHRGRQLIAEYEADHGVITDEELAAVDAKWSD